MFFPGYANLKLAFADQNGKNSLGSLLLAGGIAGGVSAGLAVRLDVLAGVCIIHVMQTPLDVVKTRLQLEGGATKYKGFTDCIARVYKEEGFAALFHGAVPRMAVVAPLFGIALLAFEMQKSYLIRSGRI
jgi:Na+/H+-dicarboxylate symporter